MTHPPPSSRKHSFAPVAVAGLLLLAASAAWVWYSFFGPGRYLEAERIKEQLAAIPGVVQVEVHGHEDFGYEINGFTLEVEGHGTLKLGGLEAASLDRLEKIHINSIGDHAVTYVVEGYLGVYRQRTGEPIRSQGWGAGFTVGASGAHASLFPFPLHSVADVVDRYDEICDVVAAWPIQPSYDKLVDSEGVQWFYALVDPSLDNSWLRPTELKAPD